MTHPAPLTLDVRPHLARGEEPFAAIMAAADSLRSGQVLRLLVPFRPVPLFSVMTNRGFTAEERALPDGLWEVVFARAGSPAEDGLSAGSSPGAVGWPDPARSVDLAGMPAKQAEKRILASLGVMLPGEVLFALLDEEPAALFPQLAMVGHEWAGNFAADGSCYRLMIRRGAV